LGDKKKDQGVTRRTKDKPRNARNTPDLKKTFTKKTHDKVRGKTPPSTKKNAINPKKTHSRNFHLISDRGPGQGKGAFLVRVPRKSGGAQGGVGPVVNNPKNAASVQKWHMTERIWGE